MYLEVKMRSAAVRARVRYLKSWSLWIVSEPPIDSLCQRENKPCTARTDVLGSQIDSPTTHHMNFGLSSSIGIFLIGSINGSYI
jgi:hypothetical protein